MKTAREVLEARAEESKETTLLRVAMHSLRALPEDYSWALVLPNGEVIDDRTSLEIAHKAIAAKKRQEPVPEPEPEKQSPKRRRLQNLWPEVMEIIPAMEAGDTLELRAADFEACRTGKRGLNSAQKVVSFRMGLLFGSGNYATTLRDGVLYVKRFE